MSNVNTSQKLFNFVASNFTKADIVEFKKNLNIALSDNINRTLKPSGLDKLASDVLGANTPNTLAATIKKKNIEDEVSALKAMLGEKNNVIPLMNITLVDGNLAEIDVTLCTDLYFDEHPSQTEHNLFSYIWLGSWNYVEPINESFLTEFIEAGGDSLIAGGSGINGFYSSEETDYESEHLAALLKNYLGVKKIKSATVCKNLEILGLTQGNFKNVDTIEGIFDAVTTCHHAVFGKVYSSLLMKGFKCHNFKIHNVYSKCLVND